MKKNINNLGHPKNNTEMYLKYLTGTSGVAFRDLPLPYTNSDTYLYYLCENGGVGGGAGGSASNVTFNDAISNLGVSNVQDALDLMNYVKADVNKANEFTARNFFKDISLESINPIAGEHLRYSGEGGGSKATGRRDFTSHDNGNNGYVNSLYIRVSNGMGVGSSTRISVWEVVKETDANSESPVLIIDNETFVVDNLTVNGGSFNVVNVPIEKMYDRPTYFIYRVHPTTDLAYTNLTGNRIPDNIYLESSSKIITGAEIATNAGSTEFVGIYWIMGADLDIRTCLDECAKTGEENIFTEQNTFTSPTYFDATANFEDINVNTSFTNNFLEGTRAGVNSNRYYGIMSQSSGMFKDGYVSHIRVHFQNPRTGNVSGLHLWSVLKSNRRFDAQIHNNLTLPVKTVDGSSFIDIPVERQFSEDTFFVVWLPQGVAYKGITQIPTIYHHEYISQTQAPVIGNQLAGTGQTNYMLLMETFGSINLEEHMNNILGNAIVDISINTNTNKFTITRANGNKVEKDITTT